MLWHIWWNYWWWKDIFPAPLQRRLPYSQYFGGVSAVTPEQYLKMNGFPNQYWGWGGEDDDIAARWEYIKIALCHAFVSHVCWLSFIFLFAVYIRISLDSFSLHPSIPHALPHVTTGGISKYMHESPLWTQGFKQYSFQFNFSDYYLFEVLSLEWVRFRGLFIVLRI